MPQNKPFFVPAKEVSLFDTFNQELIDDIAGQYVDIYRVSAQDTNPNIYGESDKKYFHAGYRVNCLISFEEPTVDLNEFGSDMNANIEVFFHRQTLKDANFYPEFGDIVEWFNYYFEINSVSEPQLIAGHQEFSHEIKIIANRMRLSNLQIEERPR